MQNTRTHVVMPTSLTAEVDELAGKRGRSRFIAEATQNELKRHRLIKLLSGSKPVWQSQDHPELKNGSAAWVRKLRNQDEKRFKKIWSKYSK